MTLPLVLKRKLNWDPERERFKNDVEANSMLSPSAGASHAVVPGNKTLNWPARESQTLAATDVNRFGNSGPHRVCISPPT
jgi:hypothetical protein